MKNQEIEILSCRCGAELNRLYNPVTDRWLTPNPSCGRCLEKMDKMEETAKKETVLKVIRQRIIPILRKAGVPNHFLNATLSNYQTSTANKSLLNRVEHYLEEKQTQGLFLFGSTGVGKTHLAASLAREFLLRGDQVLFQNMHRLFLTLRSCFGVSNHASTEKEHLDCYRDSSILILDDLGAEQVTPWSRSILSIIINDRYESSPSRLIITSNLNLKQIEQNYAPRVASRIIGMCEILHVSGPDFRLREK